MPALQMKLLPPTPAAGHQGDAATTEALQHTTTPSTFYVGLLSGRGLRSLGGPVRGFHQESAICVTQLRVGQHYST